MVWISQQLGHVNMTMLLTTYSKWIDAADRAARDFQDGGYDRP